MILYSSLLFEAFSVKFHPNFEMLISAWLVLHYLQIPKNIRHRLLYAQKNKILGVFCFRWQFKVEEKGNMFRRIKLISTFIIYG